MVFLLFSLIDRSFLSIDSSRCYVEYVSIKLNCTFDHLCPLYLYIYYLRRTSTSRYFSKAHTCERIHTHHECSLLIYDLCILDMKKSTHTQHEQRMLIRISFWFHTFNSDGSKQQRLFESIGWRSFTRYHLLLIWITWRSWVSVCIQQKTWKWMYIFWKEKMLRGKREQERRKEEKKTPTQNHFHIPKENLLVSELQFVQLQAGGKVLFEKWC